MAGMEQIQGLALQQTLSPQMQQSLHILQAPLMELRQLVTAELEANPTLEEEPREVAREPEDQELDCGCAGTPPALFRLTDKGANLATTSARADERFGNEQSGTGHRSCGHWQYR
jgi:DNA-directed RNA polymerase specialized sigma54-like protein